jgi:hypothetical protein
MPILPKGLTPALLITPRRVEDLFFFVSSCLCESIFFIRCAPVAHSPRVAMTVGVSESESQRSPLVAKCPESPVTH